MVLIPDGPLPFEVNVKGERREGKAWYIYTGDQEAFLESVKKTVCCVVDGMELDVSLAVDGGREQMSEFGMKGDNGAVDGGKTAQGLDERMVWFGEQSFAASTHVVNTCLEQQRQGRGEAVIGA